MTIYSLASIICSNARSWALSLLPLVHRERKLFFAKGRVAAFTWSALLLFAFCAPATAQNDGAPPAENTITVTLDGPTDQLILDRISNIYSQLGELSEVEVRVVAGVVTISGSVSNAAQAERAIALARRVEGVVTVQDNIERVLDVEGNVAPLVDQFRVDIDRWIRALPLLALAMGVFVVIAFTGHLLAKWAALWQKVTPNPFLSEIVTQAIRVTAVVMGLVVALNLLGATTLMGTILGGAGVIGLTVGFAVRDTVENYISSIMLSLRQPFRANEHVVINDLEGRVVRLTSRATVLMTLDGNHLRIPNAQVFKAVILNYSRNPQRRFQFELGVDAEDDPLAAIETGLAAMKKLEFVLTSPKSDAAINAVGDSNILISFFGWVDQENTDFYKARSLAIRTAKIALEEAGFTLPEPIYRLRFDQLPSTLTDASIAPIPADTGTEKTKDKAITTSANDNLDSLDVIPDMHIERIVDEERKTVSEPDLLDSTRPVE